MESSNEAGSIVVSGATGTLGRAIVERLSRNGWPVVGLARTESALTDLARLPGVTAVVADLASDGLHLDGVLPGPVAGVVHAAGATFGGGILEVDLDVLLAGINLKVNGLLRLMRAVDHKLGAGARVVALGGNLGFDPTAGAAVPGVANAALANVVRQLSRALGRRGITVHHLAPGPVDTPRLRARAKDEARYSGETLEHAYARYAAASPLGRLVTIEEVAWAVHVLFAPEAGALTGSTLFLDTGARTAIP